MPASPPPGPDAPVRDERLDSAFLVVASHVTAQLGSAERVHEACATLRELLADPAGRSESSLRYQALAALLADHAGPAARALFEFLAGAVRERRVPAPIIPSLLGARDPEIRRDAMALVLELAEAADFEPEAAIAASLARAWENSARDAALLPRLAAFLRRLRPAGGAPATTGGAPGAPEASVREDRIEGLFAGEFPPALRGLAADILEAETGRPSRERVVRLVGEDAAASLLPYLEYTRATHRDLVDFTPLAGAPPPALESLRAAEDELEPSCLAELIGRLGWARVAWGIDVERLVGLSVKGSYPVALAPAEADIAEARVESRRSWDRWIVIAHGGAATDETSGDADQDAAVRRFKGYSLAHAEVLGEILDIAPLTAGRGRRIMTHMDRIVEDFQILFTAVTEEADRLGSWYAPLGERVRAVIGDAADDELLGPEAVRLVQVFEDPQVLGDVRTIHGLKRYLHQSGLRSAFRLFQNRRATNRTVDIAVLSGRRILQVTDCIRYLDFEPEAGVASTALPFPVALAAHAVGRQLLEGRTVIPRFEILIYGNEVQIYAAFRNHPAFARIDFSPPLRGGMIDLEYYGVSQYELAQHPDTSLQAIQRFFHALDFGLELDGYHLHARYDKERALDLGDLIEKAEGLFRLFPYLMDVDWTIGGMEYSETARAAIAGAWAQFFLRWGVLPIDAFLTADRCHVLASVSEDSAGRHEIAWDGAGEYRDRFTGTWSDELAALVRRSLHARPGTARAPLPPSHEADRFARMLVSRDAGLRNAIRTAHVVAPIERQLRFRTTGSVQGYPVQEATLPLRGERITVYVLRDRQGLIRLADTPEADIAGLLRLLRRDNYVAAGFEPVFPAIDGEADRIVREMEIENPQVPIHPLPGDRLVAANPASPGRASGFARLRPAGGGRIRSMEEAVFIAAVLRPDDAPLLRRAAAIVSTGGGILSHVGLIALELAKPALVVGGRWAEEPGGTPVLICPRTQYREEESRISGYHVVRRSDIHEGEDHIRDGDLVVVDADSGALTILGQDRDALMLHQELRQLSAAAVSLAAAREARDLLAHRGRVLRATHQLQKLLARIDRPDLARHAARELVTPAEGAPPGDQADRSALLAILFANPACGNPASAAVRARHGELLQREESLRADALRQFATMRNAYEILYLRLSVLRVSRMTDDAGAMLALSGMGVDAPKPRPDLDGAAMARLRQLRRGLAAAARENGEDWRETHLRACLADLDAVLERAPARASKRRRTLRRDAEESPARGRRLARLATRRIVRAKDGGHELAPFAGPKAGNLGDIARALGPTMVPAWFALTAFAFQEMLATEIGDALRAVEELPPEARTLAAGIDAILARNGLDAARQSAAIRRLWQGAGFPAGLEAEIRDAYRTLAGDEAAAVAVRSSAFEEDREASAWAGQFDTFLFVSGEESLLTHLRLAWAGFWTERALHQRALAGAGDAPPATGAAPEPARATGGGVIVQRMIASRVSGVLHTVSLATGRLDEMVVNAGLGIGEGIVSGIVDVDQILVSKTPVAPGEPLRFRYRVGDKRERVVFDERAGSGTRRVETLYHQRLRAALEYFELQELVAAAARLEAVWGRPLDVEFGYEGSALYILQVRPIGVFATTWRVTLDRHPLAPRCPPRGEEAPS